MRRFVVIGQKATASPDFLLGDIPGTSGRLDVLLRCVRAALLFSHGLRRDTVVYLVLGGGPLAPRSVRIDGAAARYVRPDERSLAVAVMKALAVVPSDPARSTEPAKPTASGFVVVRSGISVCNGGLDAVLADIGPGALHVLDENARDVRDATVDTAAPVFFVGDHLGFDAETRARLDAAGAVSLSVGPVSLHAEDAIAVVCNELDRRELGVAAPSPVESAR